MFNDLQELKEICLTIDHPIKILVPTIHTIETFKFYLMDNMSYNFSTDEGLLGFVADNVYYATRTSQLENAIRILRKNDFRLNSSLPLMGTEKSYPIARELSSKWSLILAMSRIQK